LEKDAFRKAFFPQFSLPRMTRPKLVFYLGQRFDMKLKIGIQLGFTPFTF